MSLDLLLDEIRACTVCAAHLPLGPRPVLRVGAGARVVVIGQAPGTRVHASGVPWDDDSGARLRDWLQLDEATFGDGDRVAILPMGFCYPGRRGGGDAPPRPECAPLWHARVLAELGAPLRLLVGQYAQAAYLGAARRRSLTETVRAFDTYLPGAFPLPHPSWRVQGWMKRNPWFEAAVLPRLREAVHAALGPAPGA